MEVGIRTQPHEKSDEEEEIYDFTTRRSIRERRRQYKAERLYGSTPSSAETGNSNFFIVLTFVLIFIIFLFQSHFYKILLTIFVLFILIC